MVEVDWRGRKEMSETIRAMCERYLASYEYRYYTCFD